MSATQVILLSNVYNEEYLLPFWLNHHKNMVDHAIIVDYKSTDKSVELIRQICPQWEIRQSRNTDFDGLNIDSEFMDIENTLPENSYKIVLNTTEFLMVYPNWRQSLIPDINQYIQFKTMTALSNTTDAYPQTLQELFKEITLVNNNYLPVHLSDNIDRSPRYMHSYKNGNYPPGRHDPAYKITNIVPGFICWFGYYPWNNSLIARKLQMASTISEHDRNCGWGWYHLWDADRQQQQRNERIEKAKPIHEYPGFYDIIQHTLEKLDAEERAIVSA